MSNFKAECETEQRGCSRTNLLLSAAVESAGLIIPVRIRNLSEMGALLEGSGLPDAGAPVVVMRGDLQVGATVAWSAGNRRGIRFDGPTPVQDWTGGTSRPLECTGLRDQRRVDAIQAAVRSGAAPKLETGPPVGQETMPCGHLEARLAEELAYVQRLLESMGDELSGEPGFIQRHARTLQSVDLASQILGHVAAIIVANDRAAAVERIGMEDLRARLKRKPLV